GATYARLLDLVGPARVKELLFTGKLIDAATAHAAGLVNRVVEPDEIATVVRQLAAEIAGNAPLTILATKEMLRRIAAHRRLPAGADHDLIERCYTSEDFRNAVVAFLDKRRPVWRGRCRNLVKDTEANPEHKANVHKRNASRGKRPP